MAHINQKTQLFENLTESEAEELQEWATEVIVGVTTPVEPQLITQWIEIFGYKGRQKLVLIATALPQKVLLSVLSRKDEAREQVCLKLRISPKAKEDDLHRAIDSLIDACHL